MDTFSKSTFALLLSSCVRLHRHEQEQRNELIQAVAYRSVFARSPVPSGVDFEILPQPLRLLQQAFEDLGRARAGDFRAADLFSSSLTRAMIDLIDRPDCPTPPWFGSLFLMQTEAFRRLTASRNEYVQKLEKDFEARVAPRRRRQGV